MKRAGKKARHEKLRGQLLDHYYKHFNKELSYHDARYIEEVMKVLSPYL